MTVRQGHGVGDNNLFQDLNQAIIKLSKMILQPLYSDTMKTSTKKTKSKRESYAEAFFNKFRSR